MKVYSFEKLEVWKLAKELSVFIYKLTGKFPSEEKFGIVSQMRRSGISIPSNIAEGSSRISNNDKSYFYTIAYSSALELLNQSIICNDLNFITAQELDEIRLRIECITQKLGGLKKSLK